MLLAVDDLFGTSAVGDPFGASAVGDLFSAAAVGDLFSAAAIGDFFGAAAVLVLYVVLAVVAIALAIGLPYAIGKLVYDRARTDDLSNPAALGFGAAFFAVLVGLFVTGIALVWLS